MCSQSSFKDSSDRGYPDDWEVIRADCLFTLEYGKGLSEKKRVAGPYPVMGSNGVVGYHNEAAVKGPGIVVGRKGSIGAVTWVDSDFWPIDTTYYVKIRRHDVSLKWLFYELAYLNPAKFRLADVVPGLKRELVHSMKVHLPLLPEQEKIAEILSIVDSAVELVDKVIAKTERLKKGLMQTLLTKGIGHTEYKDTPIGKTPKTWQTVRLKDVILEAKSGFASGKRDENGILQLRMDSIETEGWINAQAGVKVPIPKNVEDYILRPGDILFNNTNSVDLIGKTAIFRGEFARCVYSNHLTRIRVTPEKVTAEWILCLLIRKWQLGVFKAICHRHVHQAGINNGDLTNLKIPLPPIPEQRRITQIFSSLDQKLKLESSEKARLGRVKRGLMDLLLTGKVRVKVD